ncbi:ABC transporter permease [Candidatus Rariloculus sp.]|uniref:ABC transporter permease n=1 Tax=Candidatus Rariloculus sp. TaxID=3101265 RepID=UPI003D150A01
MKRIFWIARRDFLAVLTSTGFIIGLLVIPTMLGLVFVFAPRIFNDQNFQIEGEYAIVDPTDLVFHELVAALDPEVIARRRLEEFRVGLAQAPETVRDVAEAVQSMEESLGPAPNVRLIDLPADTDIEAEKVWLNEEGDGLRHTALIVIHENAVVATEPESEFGTYDLFVPPGLDDRDLEFMHSSIREAIINARVSAQSLERAMIDSIVRVPRQRSTTVSPDAERQTVGGFNFILPVAFMMLMFMGIMTGGGTMLTSTIEEKSSRVVEILLSAVSPMELMAGKLLGSISLALVAMSLYILIGLALLSTFSLFGLLDIWLIPYLLIFFLIGFLVIGSLMLAIGAAVNEMSEAQSLQMPLMMIVMIPWFIWPAVSRDPNSTLSVVVSFFPPINSFGMLLRMASSQPPPWWQVWLSIGVGAASVVGAIWVAAKVFRIGLLMHGKPPNLKTLLRWIRAA